MDGANLAAHRAVAIAIGSLLLIAAIVLIEARDAGGGGRWNISPLPRTTASRLERRLTELQARVAAATVRMSGEMSEARGTTVMAGAMPPRMLTLTERSGAPLLAIVMLFGAAVASRAWGLGWARTAVVAMIGIAGAIFLPPIVGGVIIGAWIGAGTPERYGLFAELGGSDAGAFLAAVVVFLIWLLVRMAVVEDTEAADAAAAPGAETEGSGGESHLRPPLLWMTTVTVVGAFIALTVAIALKAQTPTLKLLERGVDPGYLAVAGALAVIGVVAALALLIVSLATRWRAARWAWVAWLPLAAFGGGGVSGAMVFLLIALAGTDEWLAARAGVPISADARSRIVRRARRPLLPVAVGAASLIALTVPVAVAHLRPMIRDTRPAELARPLNAIPARLNDWMQASSDQPRDPDIATILGTPNFLLRSYVNARQLGGSQTLAAIRMRTPEAVVDAWITFYTGPDQLARDIPDRSAAADGYQTSGSTLEHWPALSKRPGDHGVRFMSVPASTANPSAIRAIDRYVAYVYYCNGEYLSDPAAVRRRLSEPGAQRPYYAKVELTMSGVAKEKVAGVMNAFLGELLPEVEKCLPGKPE